MIFHDLGTADLFVAQTHHSGLLPEDIRTDFRAIFTQDGTCAGVQVYGYKTPKIVACCLVAGHNQFFTGEQEVGVGMRGYTGLAEMDRQFVSYLHQYFSKHTFRVLEVSCAPGPYDGSRMTSYATFRELVQAAGILHGQLMQYNLTVSQEMGDMTQQLAIDAYIKE